MGKAMDRRTVGRKRRHLRVRKRISGGASCPRLCIYRSLRHFHAQLVDDDAGRVVLGVSSVAPTFAGLREPGRGKQEVAREVGRELAKRAREGGIETAVFDRSGYRYHGRVKACAEGAREAGLKF